LKRSVGDDVIVARVEGSAERARHVVSGVRGVRGVEIRWDELVVTTTDGPATIGPIAVALNGIAPVRHLTLRTPTLDDVFLELTGNHIEGNGHIQPDDAVEAAELMEVAR